MAAIKDRGTIRGRQMIRAARLCRMIRSGRLPAASLLEAIVASVVWLVVFAASLETVVRLSAGPSYGLGCAEADYRAAHVLEKVREGTYGEGTTRLTFGWGSLTIRIEPYDPCPSLWYVTLTVEITCERKRMEYRHLVDPDRFDHNPIKTSHE